MTNEPQRLLAAPPVYPALPPGHYPVYGFSPLITLIRDLERERILSLYGLTYAELGEERQHPA